MTLRSPTKREEMENQKYIFHNFLHFTKINIWTNSGITETIALFDHLIARELKTFWDKFFKYRISISCCMAKVSNLLTDIKQEQSGVESRLTHFEN